MASLSSTSHGMYKDCPKKYQYQYVLKFKPAARPNTRPFLEGDCVHRVLDQGFMTKKPLDKEKLMAMFPTFWTISLKHQEKQGVVQLNFNETLEGIKKKTEGILSAAIDYIKERKWDEGSFWNEYPIGQWNAPYSLGDGLYVHGKADYIRDMGEYLFLTDFKTSKDTKYLKAAQIILYIIVVEKLLKKPVREASFTMFRNNEQIPVRITEEDKQKVLDDFKYVSKQIDTGQFVPTPSEKVCGECIFKKDCKDSLAKVSDTDKYVAILQTKPNVFSLGEIDGL